MDLSGAIREAARRAPDKLALIEAADGAGTTYAALDQMVSKAAASLVGAGIARGDRVLLALPNGVPWIVWFYGILRADAVVVPLNTTLATPEVERICSDAAIAAAVLDDERASHVRPALASDIPVFSPHVEPGDAPAVEGTAQGDHLAVLAYTSGTTGAPRGVMLSHRNLIANIDQQMAVEQDRVREEDVILLSLPLFHIFGLNVPLGLMVRNAASAVIADRFEPVQALRLIERHRVSVVFGAPPMYHAWVETPGAEQYDTTSVRLAVSGAAALPEDVLARFKEIFGIDIYEGYGLTETAPTLTTNRVAPAPRPRSIGKELPGVELRLVDAHGVDVEPGDPGEIVVRGDNVFSGYWNRPDETAAAFIDGWFRTGDVAVRDEDGYLYIVDRKKDLIIVSGFNVYPSEVETALEENPKVARAAVVGEPHPYTGEAVVAYVKLEEGESSSESQLLADIAGRLARFKCPSSIHVVDELPQLPTGKVLRRALRT